MDTGSRIFLLAHSEVENSFPEICDRLEGKSLHWLDFKNGALLWKKSSCGTDSLMDYIDTEKTAADKRIVAACMKSGSCEVNEDSIWDLGERTVLVVDEPGMGKSSTTTQVAWHTKLADPTSWVVRINWNDHTMKLKEINTDTFNLDSLVEFLCSAAFPKSKYTYINRILFKQALQNIGNVTILMDGFDEISPIHAEKAAAVLSELMKTEVGRVWVTSRPVEKERLEKKLSVFAFNMKKLSRVSQEEMLLKHWIPKAGGKERDLVNFIRRHLGLLNRTVLDENFTGSPLYITITSTVFEMDMKTHLNSEYWTERRIDLVDLYEIFIERKLQIYATEKQKADVTNSSVLDDLEYLKEIFFKNFEKCALVAILPPNVLKSLHNKKIKEEIEPFLGKVQAGKDKRGIVMNVIEGKPQFVHRTFAEYFTARWFSRNFEFNRSIMEHILFDPAYTFVRGIFHRMLAKHSPLHCAALEWDDERFETLLEEGSDVSSLDKGGRTVMHIIAQDHGLLMVDPDFYKKVSLVKRDNVLQWTPMQYAIKSEKWFIVERLLESNVDRSGLDMIMHKAQDPHYIDSLILHSAENGHLSLLELLCSIGVNIHQASSRRFPSPLHAAIQEQQLKVVKWLIQHGADCNTPYSDGHKPLLHAVTESSLDVVRALVEEGGASVDISDYCGGTVTDWINDYASDPKNSVIITRECKAERLNEIVKYLKERERQESSNVQQKYDA
jgi:ankyrin repeat protein